MPGGDRLLRRRLCERHLHARRVQPPDRQPRRALAEHNLHTWLLRPEGQGRCVGARVHRAPRIWHVPRAGVARRRPLWALPRQPVPAPACARRGRLSGERRDVRRVCARRERQRAARRHRRLDRVPLALRRALHARRRAIPQPELLLQPARHVLEGVEELCAARHAARARLALRERRRGALRASRCDPPILWPRRPVHLLPRQHRPRGRLRERRRALRRPALRPRPDRTGNAVDVQRAVRAAARALRRPARGQRAAAAHPLWRVGRQPRRAHLYRARRLARWPPLDRLARAARLCRAAGLRAARARV